MAKNKGVPVVFKTYGDSRSEWIRIPATLAEVLEFTTRTLSNESFKTETYWYINRDWDEGIFKKALAPTIYGLERNPISSLPSRIRNYQRVHETDADYQERVYKGPKVKRTVEYYLERIKGPDLVGSGMRLMNTNPGMGFKHNRDNAVEALRQLQNR